MSEYQQCLEKIIATQNQYFQHLLSLPEPTDKSDNCTGLKISSNSHQSPLNFNVNNYIETRIFQHNNVSYSFIYYFSKT